MIIRCEEYAQYNERGVFTPILAAGIGLAAAGAGLSIAANNADQSAINAARSKESAAQQGYQARASGIFNQNLPNNSAAAAQAEIAKGQGERQNAFSALRNVAQTNSAPGIASATPAQAAAARASTAGNTYTGNQVAAQSKLGGYGDWATALGTANSNTNNQLGVINNEARGNAAQLPGQIERASHTGDSLGNWGRIIGALGTVVGGAGA